MLARTGGFYVTNKSINAVTSSQKAIDLMLHPPTIHTLGDLLKCTVNLTLLELGLFGTLKLAFALQFIVTNAYFSVACSTKVSVRATLK